MTSEMKKSLPVSAMQAATIQAALLYWKREGLLSGGVESDIAASCGGELAESQLDELIANAEKIANSGGLLMSDSYGHIFEGTRESTVRWVIDTHTQRLLVADVSDGTGGWHQLSRNGAIDLLQDIRDNDVLDAPSDFDAYRRDTLPAWANRAFPWVQLLYNYVGQDEKGVHIEFLQTIGSDEAMAEQAASVAISVATSLKNQVNYKEGDIWLQVTEKSSITESARLWVQRAQEPLGSLHERQR